MDLAKTHCLGARLLENEYIPFFYWMIGSLHSQSLSFNKGKVCINFLTGEFFKNLFYFFHFHEWLLLKHSDDKYGFWNEFNVKNQTLVMQTKMRPQTKAITASSRLGFSCQSQSKKIKHNVWNLLSIFSYKETVDCLFFCYDGPEYLFYFKKRAIVKKRPR